MELRMASFWLEITSAEENITERERARERERERETETETEREIRFD